LTNFESVGGNTIPSLTNVPRKFFFNSFKICQFYVVQKLLHGLQVNWYIVSS